jgi:hypothetical protein
MMENARIFDLFSSGDWFDNATRPSAKTTPAHHNRDEPVRN